MGEMDNNANEEPDQTSSEHDEDDEAYILRVYGSPENQDKAASTRRSKKATRSGSIKSLRRFSKKLSKEFERRRSSIEVMVEEVRPKTPTGWTIFLSTVCASVLGYEVNLQRKLTAPPLVFAQCAASNSTSSPSSSTTNSNSDSLIDRQMSMIYKQLTATPDSILARKIQPSLFVGTRGLIASTASYLFGGPSSENDNLHIRFREVLTMSQDGAKLAVDWEVPRNSPPSSSSSSTSVQLSPEERKEQFLKGPIQQPVVLIIHGMNNDSSFGYMRSFQRTFADRGWAAAALNFRGVGGIHLVTPRGYNAGYTGDIRNVVLQISARLDKNVPLFLIGNSLGANIMTKYLGEEGFSRTLPQCVAGAVSLGNPLIIRSGILKFPFNMVLAMGVKKMVLENASSLMHVNDPNWRKTFWKALLRTRTLAQLDSTVAPLMARNSPYDPFEFKVGYKDGDEYWRESSSYRYIGSISVPFLNLSAQDDMIVREASHSRIGYCISNPNVMVVETRCGGHLGWQESPPDSKHFLDFGAIPWSDTASADFFQAIIDSRHHSQAGDSNKPSISLGTDSSLTKAKPLESATAFRSRL